MKRTDMPRMKKIAVRGLVIPAAWDKRGRVTSIVFAADDEKEYRIGPDGTLREFLTLIHRELEVVGWTSTTRDRLHLLEVEHYQVLGQPALNQGPS